MQEPLAKRSLCHGSSLIHSGGFILPEELHPHPTSTRHPHSLSEAAFPRGTPTHTSIQGTACVPAIMAPTNSCDAKYCGVLVIITQMCKCLQDKNLPVWLLEVMTEQSTGQHTVVLLFCLIGICDVPLQEAPQAHSPIELRSYNQPTPQVNHLAHPWGAVRARKGFYMILGNTSLEKLMIMESQTGLC